VYAGTQVAGHPFGASDDSAALEAVVAASQDFLTAIIEGTPQDGMTTISSLVPTVRLLSFNQDYVDRRLRPADLVDKYLLAVSERNVRLLYLRPYTTTELGDLIVNTESLISRLSQALTREGYVVGPLDTLDLDYTTSPLLRGLAALGVLAALALVALLFPAPWGALAAAGLVVLSLAAAGPSWGAIALLAALVFPVLGYLNFPRRLYALLAATALSLAGALLLAAVGSERLTLLAIKPFSGVGLTLVVPPALFLAGAALRRHRPATLIRRSWNAEVRVWHVALALGAVAALAVVVLRRGNDPVIGVSEIELTLRQTLGELFARPRFKELLGHPLALLGLGLTAWPSWSRWALLTGGVVAQASILNSFSHYHTPLTISLERTLVALVGGLVIGLVALPLVRLATRLVGRWLQAAPDA